MPAIASSGTATSTVEPFSSRCWDIAEICPFASHFAGDDARHVGAMPKIVAQRSAGIDGCEVAMIQRWIELEVLVHREVRVGLVDSRVHDTPYDVLPECAEGGTRCVRLHRADRLSDEGLELEIGPDLDKSRASCATPAFGRAGRLP